MISEIAKCLQQRNRFAITSHARPDGDAIGSELGLALALREAGKEVAIVNADPHPSNYSKLPGTETIQIATRLEGHFDAVVVLECSNLGRTGLQNLEQYFVVNIDHHPKNEGYGDLRWFDAEAAAVGEMVYHLLERAEIPVSPQVATNLYVSLVSDTGSFKFSNTTARTFSIASSLVEAGADPGRIAELVYMNQPESRLRLLSRLLESLEFHPSRKISWMKMDRRMLDQAGASARDTEGLVNYALGIEGVLMCALFREEEDCFRASLRSKGELDIGSVAESLGGGGHRNAAGVTLTGNYSEVRDRVIRELEKKLP